MGIKDLVITSDGETIENKKLIEKHEKKLKRLNRWLARCKVGSKNRYKVKIKLQVVYKKLKNARKNLIHNISNKIVKGNDIIVTETLKISKMVETKKIYDASWYELIRQLEYKSKWKNKKTYKIETYYASSQICSRCRNENNRDINASINIMFEGLKKYMKEELNELQVS